MKRYEVWVGDDGAPYDLDTENGRWLLAEEALPVIDAQAARIVELEAENARLRSERDHLRGWREGALQGAEDMRARIAKWNDREALLEPIQMRVGLSPARIPELEPGLVLDALTVTASAEPWRGTLSTIGVEVAVPGFAGRWRVVDAESGHGSIHARLEAVPRDVPPSPAIAPDPLVWGDVPDLAALAKLYPVSIRGIYVDTPSGVAGAVLGAAKEVRWEGEVREIEEGQPVRKYDGTTIRWFTLGNIVIEGED